MSTQGEQWRGGARGLGKSNQCQAFVEVQVLPHLAVTAVRAIQAHYADIWLRTGSDVAEAGIRRASAELAARNRPRLFRGSIG